MMILDREYSVIRMASELNLAASATPVSSILRFCLQKIDRWLRESESESTARTLSEVQETACARLRLAFEEIWSDDDLQRVVSKYVARGEIVFATLADDLDPQTFAALFERKHATASSQDRYVAVIDCRGSEKAARRFFTRWHEIAHLITLARQLELPFHRSTTNRDPLERLMDVIAGEIGFYDPLVRPAVRDEVRKSGILSFEGVERVRDRVCPDASFHATLIACVSRSPRPAVLVEAGMGFKKAERAALHSQQRRMFPTVPPKAQLRVASATRNEAARQNGLRIDKNMQVPSDSLVYRHFHAEGLGMLVNQHTVESLSIWRHSDGTAVGDGSIQVQTRRVGDRVLALIQPAHQVDA